MNEDNNDDILERHTVFLMKLDCRLIALQSVIEDTLELDQDRKVKFRALIDKVFDRLVQERLEQAENSNPELAARVLRGWNPYSKDQSDDEGKS